MTETERKRGKLVDIKELSAGMPADDAPGYVLLLLCILVPPPCQGFHTEGWQQIRNKTKLRNAAGRAGTHQRASSAVFITPDLCLLGTCCTSCYMRAEKHMRSLKFD